MKTKRGLILLLTDNPNLWVLPHIQDSHEFIISGELMGAVKTLHNIRYDLIMIDEQWLGDQLLTVVEELKRRFPTLPVLALTNETNYAHDSRLIRVGIDDLLSPRMSKDELLSHVRLMLKQHTQNRMLVERNQKLYLIASLTRLLETSDEPRLVILNAIHFITNMFGVDGIAVMLRESSTFRLYAGNPAFISKNQLFDSVLHPGDHDPFLWTMRSRLIHVHEDISRSPHYVPIPIFPESTGAAFFPLVNNREVIGALGVFAPDISPDDLFIYEQFAAQFGAGLRTAYQHQAQRLNLQTNERLLDAWRAFAPVSSPVEVAQALARVVASIPLVTRAVAWLFDGSRADNFGGQIVNQLAALNTETLLDSLNYRPGGDNPPRAIARDEAALLPVLNALASGQVTSFPIQNAGLLFVSAVEGYALDMPLVQHIIQIAVYALQRIHLNEEILKSHARVMSVLVSISEGIFFVDEGGRVVMCNPQVSELTRVPASAFVNQAVDVLLRAIADETGTPAHTLAHLELAHAAIRESEQIDYPIVGVTLADGIELNIDFVKFLNDGDSISWVGVVRLKAAERESLRLDALFERVSYAQTRSLITTLADQHGSLNYGERQRLLDDLEAGIERIGRQWDSVIDLYRLRYGEMPIRRETIVLNDVIQRVIGGRVFNRVHRLIRLDMPAEPIPVTVDEYALARAITILLQRAVEASPPGAPIQLGVENGRDVRIVIEDSGSPMPPAQLESPDGENANTSVYIAAELVRRSAGHVYAGTGSGGGTLVQITLPVNNALADVPRLVPSISTSPVLPSLPTASMLPAARAPQRELERIMVIKGRSALTRTLMEKLEEVDYEVIDYASVEHALPAVTEAHWDLIIIDAKLGERSGIDVCKRIRQKSEVPIILLADEGTGQDKADGLNAGADEYMTNPITHDELLARVRVIFNRRHLPDRTSEPLLLDTLYIDFARRAVFLDNKPLELTRIEYDLLYTLVTHKGQTVTHKQLLSQVWGPEHQGETQYLWVNISRLRKKLEPTPNSLRYIRTQPGVGYFFDAG